MIKANRKCVLLASIIVMLSVMLSMMPIQAMASETVKAVREGDSISATYNGSFASAWQLSKTSGNASLVYGFNTTLIDEDYAWAYHSTRSHWAEIHNGNGVHYGDEVTAGNVSKIEVRHNGSSITYYCIWA